MNDACCLELKAFIFGLSSTPSFNQFFYYQDVKREIYSAVMPLSRGDEQWLTH